MEKLTQRWPEALQTSQNLMALLDYRAVQQPSQVAYQYLHRGEQVESQLTYQQLQDQARLIAAHLIAMGASGGRALLLFSPGLDFVVAFLACLYAGVTAVPAYPPRKNQKTLRLQAIVEDAEASVVLTTSDLSGKVGQWVESASPLGQIHWLPIDTLEEIEKDITGISPNPLAFLQYTSGSTGTPKGVMVSHGNLMHNLEAIYRCFGHGVESKGVIWLPPYHDMGLIGGILQPLYGGFPVTLMAPVDFLQKPLRWLRAISEHRATTSGGPDFAYDLCDRKFQELCDRPDKPDWLSTLDLSSWRVAFTGAEPVRADTLERFSRTFAPYGFCPEAFYPCYGMAETTLIVSGGAVSEKPLTQTVSGQQLAQNVVSATAATALDAYRLVSCGRPIHAQQVLIVDPHTLCPCDPEQVGEIWVTGPSVAQGYWKKPTLSQQTFNAYLASDRQADASAANARGPFLRTGDLGFIQAGELFITGRIKDVMIIRGQNHYPQDIERTVENTHQSIRANACAAFSVDIKGAERLVVVAEIERTALRRLDAKAVSGAIRRAISANHDLQVYASLLVRPGSIPKTSSGKIQRYRCRDLFLSGELSIVEDWSENPQHKREFVKIQSDVESLLQKVGRKS